MRVCCGRGRDREQLDVAERAAAEAHHETPSRATGIMTGR
jgi:hypothetical protein